MKDVDYQSANFQMEKSIGYIFQQLAGRIYCNKCKILHGN